ncbi:hypothetical protein KGY71_05025, partial [Candidatus Bipolaricaulota bacterium]|nr:hypothetical protein [Candidatus Bipolaricaulota bacterium]
SYLGLGFILVLLLVLLPAGATASNGENPESVLDQMTLEEKIGQLLMVKALEGSDGEPAERTKGLIQELGAGSVIFYSLPGPKSATKFTNKLQKWAMNSPSGVPLLVGADLEYGVKANVGGKTTLLPHQMGIGATGEPKLARRAAAITAREGKSMGINWNFAPTADLNTNPNNPVIGVRSFGSDPETVSSFVESAVEGYQSNEMVATLKHYPGHGNTSTDSHYGLPSVTYSRNELDLHLKPFKAGIDAGADAVMTAHILVDSIDSEKPATTSKKLITDLLRDKQGFEGVVVTDALNMGAIEENFGKAEAAVNAINAGVDVVMSAGNYWDALEIRDGLLKAVDSGEISVSSVNKSVKRVLELKEEYGLLNDYSLKDPAEAVKMAGNQENRRVADELALEAVTLVRDEKDLIPVTEEDTEILLVGVKDSVHLFEDELKERLPGLEISVYRTPSSNDYNDWSPSSAGIEEAAELASNSDKVILLTYSSDQLPEAQIKMTQELMGANDDTIVIAEGLPYDYRNFPEVPAYMATYSYNRWNSPRAGNELMTEAAAKVLSGEAAAGGELPVSLENKNDKSKR